MGLNRPDGLKLYNFVDNHDVERIYTKLYKKEHFAPVHILLYTLPGIPSIYYGSEFGVEGKKERGSDASLRPSLSLEDYTDALEKNACTKLIAALGNAYGKIKALVYGDYQELMLTNRQYAFARNDQGVSVIVTVNNDDQAAAFDLPVSCGVQEYVGVLYGKRIAVKDGRISVTAAANNGEIWVPAGMLTEEQKQDIVETAVQPEEEQNQDIAENTAQLEEEQNQDIAENTAQPAAVSPKSYEEMSIEELQEAILDKMRRNGPITDQMLRDVRENVYHNSLLNWVRSFR